MSRLSEVRLRSAFARILGSAALIGPATVVAACGGGTTDIGGTSSSSSSSSSSGASGQPATFTSLCGVDGIGSIAQSVTASPAVDFVQSRYESAFPNTDSTYPSPVVPDPTSQDDQWSLNVTTDQQGTMCATASDKAACQAKVDAYRVLPGDRAACVAQYPGASYGSYACNVSYLIYTRGDAVGVARTDDEIRALASTFDTVGEAMWAAGKAGYQSACSTGGAYGVGESSFRYTDDGGWDLKDVITNACDENVKRATLHVDFKGSVTITSETDTGQMNGCPVAGRRPSGYLADAATSDRAIGEHFAQMARLEAASVVAFRRLHRQLEAHGAPRELLDRVRKAARDEIRHARATRILAVRHGVTATTPRIEPASPLPSLFEIALENAREGCVRETYGALVAHAQAEASCDPEVRAMMATIAGEETEHAALSWDIAAWIEERLDAPARARLARERRAAVAELASELAAPVQHDVQQISGIPSSRDALRMLERLAPTLLAA